MHSRGIAPTALASLPLLAAGAASLMSLGPKVVVRERTQRFARWALKLPETADLRRSQARCRGGGGGGGGEGWYR